MKCPNCGGVYPDAQPDGGVYQHACSLTRVTSEHGDDQLEQADGSFVANPKRSAVEITDRRQAGERRMVGERRRGERRQVKAAPGGPDKRSSDRRTITRRSARRRGTDQ